MSLSSRHRRRFLGTASLGGVALLTGCVANPNAGLVEPATTTIPARPVEAWMQEALQPNKLMVPNRAQPLNQIYLRTGYRPLWHDGKDWTQRGRQVFDLLLNADSEGLLVYDYLPIGSNRLPRDAKRLDLIASADIMLTDGLARYLRDMTLGRDPNKPRSDGMALLDQAVRQPDIASWTASLAPNNAQYQGLKTALGGLRPLDSKRGLIAVNMEKWRTQQLQVPMRDVFVNLPTFHLEARTQGQIELDMPVVVGKTERRTPLLQGDRITNLKFSPDWGVPSTIEAEDIIPILRAKPELFEKMGLEAIANGQIINVATVDWSKVDPNKNIFYFRQPPGPDNALGGVRFSLTNPQDIFLHDSPDKKKFGAKNRALSSGCVRVGDAAALAHWLLKDQPGWTQDRVKEFMNLGQTRVQGLPAPMPLTMGYYTAWVGKGGKVKYGMDVYGHDAELAKVIDFGTPPKHPFVPALISEADEDVARGLSP